MSDRDNFTKLTVLHRAKEQYYYGEDGLDRDRTATT